MKALASKMRKCGHNCLATRSPPGSLAGAWEGCIHAGAYRHRSSDITNVNRWRRFDSKLSLDAGFRARDYACMIAQPYHLYVERIEPERNMARFYAFSVQPTLFGEVSLVRCWGRIGSRGQQIVHVFNEEKHAVSLFLELLRQKRNRGYGPKRVVEIQHFQHSLPQLRNDKVPES